MNISEYEYLWTTEKNDWVLVNTSFGYSIVNKTEQMVLLVSDEELEQALIEKMLSNGCTVYDNIKDAYNDVPGGAMIGEDIVLCEKCGHEMTSFREGHDCGMICHNCGWGVATSYFEPYEIDLTDYHILLTASYKPSIADIRVVSNIANCNYIEAKNLIENAPVEIYCGQAMDIMKIRERLVSADIEFVIKPEFPY